MQAYRLIVSLAPIDPKEQFLTGEPIARVRLVTLQDQAAGAFEAENAYLAGRLAREVIRDALALKAKA